MQQQPAPPVKVKIIVTEYVQTDALHFKSVVQSLTGNGSTVGEASQGKNSLRRQREGLQLESNSNQVGWWSTSQRDTVTSSGEVAVRLAQKQLPSMDELPRLLMD